MNPNISRLVGSAALALFPTLVTAQASAASVELHGPSVAPAPGETFVVNVVGSGFEPVVGGGLNLSFSADLVELVNVVFDPAWNFFTDAGQIDNAAGTLTDMSFNVWGSLSGSFAIATLEFVAKSAGSAPMVSAASDLFPFSTPAATVPAVSFGGVVVDIATPVPEPGSWALMLGGLALIGSFVARRRSPAIGR